ncbi:hypothetical protein ACP4OV_011172 [Aristida adscensionis]
MPVLDENRAAATADHDAGAPGGQRCSCLPFCLWAGGSARSSRSAASRGGAAGGEPGKSRRRRWRRLRLRLRIKLSWFAWLRKSGGGEKADGGGSGGKKKGKKGRGRRLLMLLTASLQARKALASVVSGDGALLPATVTSFGDAKKQQNRSKPSPTVSIIAAPSSTGHPQPSTATAASTREISSTAAPARSLPATTTQPCPNKTDEPPAAAGRIRRAPSRRRHSLLRQPARGELQQAGGAGGLWTAATTLGVIVLFGRVTAVVFLCTCLYGARFIRLRVAGAGARKAPAIKRGVAGGGASGRRFGDPVGVAAEKTAEACTTEEGKKKVVMAGLLARAGRRPSTSSRFDR